MAWVQNTHRMTRLLSDKLLMNALIEDIHMAASTDGWISYLMTSLPLLPSLSLLSCSLPTITIPLPCRSADAPTVAGFFCKPPRHTQYCSVAPRGSFGRRRKSQPKEQQSPAKTRTLLTRSGSISRGHCNPARQCDVMRWGEGFLHDEMPI